jgi:hypothetical protein
MVNKKDAQIAPEIIMDYDDEKDAIPEKEQKVQEREEFVSEPKSKEKREKIRRKKRREHLKKEIEAPIDEVIQELLDSEKTFVENITRKAKKSVFSSFYPFPKKISFLTIGKDEAVVLVVRHHWSGLLKKIFLAIFTFAAPFLLAIPASSWFEGTFSLTFFISGLFIFFFMLAVTILLDAFLKWFFEMNVITTKRIVDVDFVSIMSHRVSETTFDQIQDVSHSPAGALAAIFDYGNLYVQTAGAKNEFDFCNIPRPRDVQDTILDLRELRRRKIARGK